MAPAWAPAPAPSKSRFANYVEALEEHKANTPREAPSHTAAPQPQLHQQRHQTAIRHPETPLYLMETLKQVAEKGSRAHP